MYKIIIWGVKNTETKSTKPIFNKEQVNDLIERLLEKETIPDFEVRFVDEYGWENKVFSRITERTHHTYKITK
jgi:hypothetical protein